MVMTPPTSSLATGRDLLARRTRSYSSVLEIVARPPPRIDDGDGTPGCTTALIRRSSLTLSTGVGTLKRAGTSSQGRHRRRTTTMMMGDGGDDDDGAGLTTGRRSDHLPPH